MYTDRLELSIIVPVYNVEAYLLKCLASLSNQGLYPHTYEVLIIDDGSVDNSLGVAEHFAKSKQNIHIFNQRNSGLGAARNVGLRNARGEYLLFVDSDDYLESNRLFTLLQQAKKQNLDILRFNYESVNEKHQIIPKSQSATFTVNMSETVVNGEDFLAHRLGWACYVPMFLFRRTLIEQYALLFREGVYFEDVDWLPRVLMRAARVSSTDLLVYYYLRRDGSITLPKSEVQRQKLIDDRLSLINNILQLERSVSHLGVKQWTRGIVTLSVIRVLTLVGVNELQPRQAKIIEGLRRLEVFPLAAPNFNWKQRLNVFIINVSPWVFIFMKAKYIKAIGTR